MNESCIGDLRLIKEQFSELIEILGVGQVRHPSLEFLQDSAIRAV